MPNSIKSFLDVEGRDDCKFDIVKADCNRFGESDVDFLRQVFGAITKLLIHEQLVIIFKVQHARSRMTFSKISPKTGSSVIVQYDYAVNILGRRCDDFADFPSAMKVADSKTDAEEVAKYRKVDLRIFSNGAVWKCYRSNIFYCFDT